MSHVLPLSRFARLGRALAHRNFRLFVVGQAISLIGTWMQQVAMLWLVYRLTNSAALLGLTGFMEQIPTFFLAPLAGVWSDRVRRHRLLVVTQSLMMAQAFVLSALVFTGRVEVWHLIVLSGFLGIVQAFDSTTRQGFMSEMVPSRENLSNAIALNSSIVNGARLVGPAIAGFLIALTGEAVCFLLNAISYLAVLGSLLAMNVPPPPPRPPHGPFWQGLREGVHYAFACRPIRNLLFLMAAVSFLGMPYTVLIPVIVSQRLEGGPGLLGWLMAASGVGAFTAALTLAARTTVVGLGLRAAFAPVVFGLGLIAFSQSTYVWLSMAILPVAGYALMMQMASVNTILQTIAPEDKRGRLMSFYMMAFLGTTPLGSLTLGYLAQHALGATGALLLGGAGCIAAAGLFILRLRPFGRELHAVYRRLDILPRAATMEPIDRCVPPPAEPIAAEPGNLFTDVARPAGP
jgi:MFS family permease